MQVTERAEVDVARRLKPQPLVASFSSASCLNTMERYYYVSEYTLYGNGDSLWGVRAQGLSSVQKHSANASSHSTAKLHGYVDSMQAFMMDSIAHF
jgi:hypothetical protein